jgi:hypothetical protein
MGTSAACVGRLVWLGMTAVVVVRDRLEKWSTKHSLKHRLSLHGEISFLSGHSVIDLRIVVTWFFRLVTYAEISKWY